MDIPVLFKGAMIGLSIAAPVGPIGVLCIRRTLAEGRLVGLVSGMGAATADAAYGSIAAFGLTFISSALVHQQAWLRLVGGLFLCFLGVRTLLARPADQAARAQARGLWQSYGSTLFLTLTNPMTILSFAAIFAGLGLGQQPGDYLSAGLLVLGVFAGSATWWLALSSGVGALRAKFPRAGLLWVNRLSGAVILVFGLVALAGLRPG